MAFTKVVGAGIHTQSNIDSHNINSTGIITATKFDGPFDNLVIGGGGLNISGIVTSTGLDVNGNGDISGNLVVGGNLTANGDFTTLNTTLREVELLRVDANADVAAGIITQTGTGDIFSAYDTSTEVFKIADGGAVSVLATGDNKGLRVHTNSGVSATNNELRFNTGQSSGFTFMTNSDGTSSNERLRITSGGLVGINTTVDAATQLQVQSDGTGTDAGDNIVARFQSNGSGRDATIQLSDNVANSATISMLSSALIFKQSGVETFHITSGGNIIFGSQTGSAVATTSSAIKNLNLGSDYWNGTKGDYRAIREHIFYLNTDDLYGFGISLNMLEIQSQQDIGFFAGGSGSGTGRREERLRIVSDGKVGINTINPLSGLHISDSTAYGSPQNSGRKATLTISAGSEASADIQLLSANYNHIFFGDSTDPNTGIIHYNHTGSDTDSMNFVTAGEQRLSITSSGNVEVNASGADQKRSIKIEGTNGSSELQGVVLESDGENAKFHIKTNAGGGTPANKLTIKAISGEVGIGTDNPEKNLDIYTGRSHSSLRLHNLNNGGTGYDSELSLLGSASNSEMRINMGVNSDPDREQIKSYQSNLIFKTATEERLRITSAGKAIFSEEIETPQDYPNFQPTLDFNFAATKKLDPRITYSRQGLASFTDEFGKVVLVGDNAPRFDHDPTTRECKGLLIEHSRTNKVNYSETLATGWSLNNSATRYKNDVVAPDGVLYTNTSTGGSGVWEVVETTSSTTHLVYQQLSGSDSPNSTACTISAFAKPGLNRTHFVLTEGNTLSATAIFDVANGTVTSTVGTGSPTAKIEGPFFNGWYRCSLTYTTASTQNYINIQLGVAQNGTTVSYAGDGSSSIAVWGIQHEVGSYVSSYIKSNNGSATTRGADYPVILEDDFTDAISQTEGTFIAEYDNVTNDGYVLSLDTGGNGKIGMVNSNSYQLMGHNGTTSQGTTDNGTLLSGTNRFALAYKTNDAAISINGNTATVDTPPYALPTTTFMSIGHRQYQYDQLGSCIARIIYYNTRLPNSQLKTLSSR